jgi:hypothetical protein
MAEEHLIAATDIKIIASKLPGQIIIMAVFAE